MAFAVMGETEHGVLCLRSFATRNEAEDYPVILAKWRRVWVVEIPAEPSTPVRPDTGEPAPLPWTSTMSVAPSGNGGFYLYLVDANGRKIAAVWGRPNEKRATAELILNAVNQH